MFKTQTRFNTRKPMHHFNGRGVPRRGGLFLGRPSYRITRGQSAVGIPKEETDVLGEKKDASFHSTTSGRLGVAPKARASGQSYVRRSWDIGGKTPQKGEQSKKNQGRGGTGQKGAAGGRTWEREAEECSRAEGGSVWGCGVKRGGILT